MEFTLHVSHYVGNEKNCLYPKKAVITSPEALISAAAFDHTTAAFKGNYRSGANFLSSDCEVMDCDNDHSNDPKTWITPEGLCHMLSNVQLAIVPSRNNGKVKDGRSERPRFHVYFPHPKIERSEACRSLKKKIYEKYPFFDHNALDSSRFIFGSSSHDVFWQDGEFTILDLLKPEEKMIRQGERNNTLSRFAGKVIKRYGATERAKAIFQEEAEKCDPPLDDHELSSIWKSASKFGEKIAKQDGYIPPEDYEFSNESLRPLDFSDIGQAKVLVQEYGEELKYTPATGYLRYDGIRWVESKQRAIGAMEEFLDLQLEDAKDEVSQAVKKLVSFGFDEKDIHAGGKALEKQIQPDQVGDYLSYRSAISYQNFVMKRRDMKYVVSALQAAKPMLEEDYEKLDSNPYFLNCPDGTYDLRLGVSGKHEHDPKDLITKVTAFSPGQEGKELWLDSVHRTFQGDRELIEYVQMITGTAAIGMVNLEALIISYGEGSNGKSTYWNTVAGVLGNYSGSISADTLTVGCRRNVKPELAEAKGKRLLIAAELEEGMRLSTSVVKQLCSTDKIAAEKKYKDPASFTPTHMLVLYTNHLPRVGAMDSGIWRRLIVIPFTAKITGQGDIKNYSRYLLDHAGPYILTWIIEGAKKAIESGFTFPQPRTVREAIEKYMEDSDWLAHFLEECCEIDERFFQSSGALYDEYRAYCQRVGDFARSTTEFYTAIEQRGFVRKRTRNGRIVVGLRLLDQSLI
jgi:putative DNA primase/helicase